MRVYVAARLDRIAVDVVVSKEAVRENSEVSIACGRAEVEDLSNYECLSKGRVDCLSERVYDECLKGAGIIPVIVRAGVWTEIVEVEEGCCLYE